MSDRNDDSLALMNAAVALIVLVPLLLLLAVAKPRSAADRHTMPVVPSTGTPLTPSPLPMVNDQPPIISVSEAEVFSFPSGAATLTPEFQRFLADMVIPRLVRLSRQYNCDVVEVIGHTDSQTVRTNSNMDEALLRALQRSGPALSAGSNADLGLMRSWAVVEFLRVDVRLRTHTFYAYSAADAILPDGRLAAPIMTAPDQPRRRRIELRLRRRL